MQPRAWIYRSTPVNHDACLMVLERELRRSGIDLDPGEGLFETVVPGWPRHIAIAGERPSSQLERFAAALGLELLEVRLLRHDEGWEAVERRPRLYP